MQSAPSWTEEEDRHLRTMLKTALAWELIADTLGRSVEVVKDRAIEKGLTTADEDDA